MPLFRQGKIGCGRFRYRFGHGPRTFSRPLAPHAAAGPDQCFRRQSASYLVKPIGELGVKLSIEGIVLGHTGSALGADRGEAGAD